ncbi:FHA domain-containing protein [Aliiruegeria lutimaris]|uniref:FHA domain-containing protein n=1 Tax=Aliiruegeria lutimaris TaxID=571298 RepID=A0A1G8VEJ9_9RHOB|nr:FHA domain-containing protein [Aliiruegeria lutimaris]SDJ64458.1 FHA domain-containing protein [Aliiruegeria lutimaris]
MRFLNELIRKTKAAHVDAGHPDATDDNDLIFVGDAGRERSEPELPHLRRPSNFDRFAANRQTEAEDVFAESEVACAPSDEDPLSRPVSPLSVSHHEGHEVTKEEFTARQENEDVIFARQAFQHEMHDSDTSAEADDPEDDGEPIAMETGRHDRILADEISQENVPLEPDFEEITFEEDTLEPQEFAEAAAIPAEDDAEDPAVTASRSPLRLERGTERSETGLPDGTATVTTPVEAPSANRADAVAKVNIWDIEGSEQEEDSFGDGFSETSAFAEPDVTPIVPEAPTQQRRSGRVRTRLLGFQRPDELSADPFARSAKTVPANAEPTFPVGWMVVEKGPGRGAFFPLFNGVSKIGRGEDQAVRLDFGDMSVSRDSHAVVAYDDEQRAFFVGHSGKTNPVRLNGMPVLSTEPFTNGDSLRIGETTLRFVALCGPGFDWDEENELGERNVAAR